jgi:imidazolonepropionase-like amidohydrolase
MISLLSAPALLLAALWAAPDQLVALEVARVITVSGEDLEEATILIEAGRIRELGRDVAVPRNATVLRIPGGVAMPGIIDCHSTSGLQVPNENTANVPYISVVDGIDPSSRALENSLRHGVATIHVSFANATRLGGQGAVIRARGRMIDDLVIKAPASMKISLAPPVGETRMGNMAALRLSFYDLFARLRDLEAEATGAAFLPERPAATPELSALVALRPAWREVAWERIPAAKIPERDRAMVELVRGQLKAFIHCPSASDAFKAFELIDANGLDATLVLGSDAWKLQDVLAAREGLGPVVLAPELEVWETDVESGEERRHVTPRLLHDAGISFALQASTDPGFHRGPSFSRSGSYHLWHQAATLVKHGVPRETALRSITLTPARILGLEHRLGSIEKGKDATIAVFSGDPLDARSWVELVLIEGEVAYRRSEDRDLELLLREPERRF